MSYLSIHRRLDVGWRALRQGAMALAAAAAMGAGAATTGVEVVAQNLSHPWGLAFIDQGRMLISERAGRLRLITPEGRVSPPIEGVPTVAAQGQGGLLDVQTDSAFATNRTVYLCYAEPSADGAGSSTALARARLSTDLRRLEALEVIFRQAPKVAGRQHFGCRIVETPDGLLFLTLGDRGHRMADAQTLDNHHGKVVRLHKDGRVPTDNPLLGQPGARPEIWSWGHRNPQGAAWGPDGRLWTVEHGPQGGDEINRPEPGKNYGWPVVTHGEQYGGGKIGSGQTQQAGMEPPLYQWTPSMAPSGMAFLRSNRYGPSWQGSLFVGSLKFRYLARLEIKDGRVVKEERLLRDQPQRIRDVREGPDGLLYVLTDAPDGQLLRLKPR